MLTKAFETIPDGIGLTFYSDQGWQYQCLCSRKRVSGKVWTARETVWTMQWQGTSSVCSKVSFFTCKKFSPHNTSNKNSPAAWTTTIPAHQGKVKGLAACNSQTTSPFGCLNNFYFEILSNFLGSLQQAGDNFLCFICLSAGGYVLQPLLG